ncbi:hypothetical protein F4778DRAFT_730233 [Xylariomycetidae sp. FL2044]|nr:hypothetical protein F4778DRAFT_730233 [Xylariomycetidae sp. FL2044]
MEKGPDELIEALLTEIAFSGTEGCSVASLLYVIDKFYKDSGDDERGHDYGGAPTSLDPSRLLQNGDGCDLSVGAKVWQWLVNRSDVSVGESREFNHLSLEEILSIPEQQIVEPSTFDPTTSQADPSTSAPATSEPTGSSRLTRRAAGTTRPRLYVSEERQWRALAGHAPDYKRIPLFEWRALVDIASIREKGILQGDLVRLTGQDKRSLPMRTESLAQKGYIIKQPVLVRGCKSSKLWLSKYASWAEENAEIQGLHFDKLDLSKETLTRDLEPVPFRSKWDGTNIDYLALSQAFIAVIKAWGLMRYGDLRTKLGVEEKVRAMRALARSCRWFTNIGATAFVPAKFPNCSRTFRDCVKFIREPTAAEWEVFRSVPKASIRVPSQRLGYGAKARAAIANAPPSSTPKKDKIIKIKQPKPKHSPQDQGAVSQWSPEKPLQNTVGEIIYRSGQRGTSNVSIRNMTLGYEYRKVTAGLTAQIAAPGAQPPHLDHLTVMGTKVRKGKSFAFHYLAKGDTIASSTMVEQAKPDALSPSATGHGSTPTETKILLVPDSGPTVVGSGISPGVNGNARAMFSQPQESKFTSSTSTNLTELSRLAVSIPYSARGDASVGLLSRNGKKLGRPCGSGPKTKIPLEEGENTPSSAKRQTKRSRTLDLSIDTSETFDSPDANSQGRPKRSTGRIADYSVIFADNDESLDVSGEQPAAPASSMPPPPPPPADRTAPGVYVGAKNSLDPIKNRKGRPPKSIVLIFRFDKLKDPAFLTGSGQLLHPSNSHTHTSNSQPSNSQPSTSHPINNSHPSEPSDKPLDGATMALGSLAPGSLAPGTTAPTPTPIPDMPDVPSQATPASAHGPSLTVPPASTPAGPSSSLSTGTPVADAGAESTPLLRTVAAAKPFPCIKCGGSWKNSIGLEYHLTKSRTLCNPNFVAPPPKLPKLPKPPRPLRQLKPAKPDKPRGMEYATPRSMMSRPQPPTRQPTDPDSADAKSATTNSGPPAFLPPSLSKHHRHVDNGASPSATKPNPVLLSHNNSIILQDVEAYNVTDRLRQGNRQPNSKSPVNGTPAVKLHDLSSHASGRSQRKAETVDRHKAKSNISHPLGSEGKSTSNSNNLEADAVSSVAEVRHPSVVSQDIPNPWDPAVNHPSSREHLLPTSQSSGLQPQGDPPLFQPYQKPNIKNGTAAAQRRQRTMHIVEYFIDNNNGAFPGNKALYLALVSLWTREYGDIPPPDMKTCQVYVNKMEAAGTIQQVRFYFMDGSLTPQECAVLVKARSGDSRSQDLASDPRVTHIKAKMRELHPDPYIPTAFSLSQEESELFEPRASQTQNYNNGRSTSLRNAIKEDIEVLQYPMPFMEEVSFNATPPKRSAEDGADAITNPQKKTRIEPSESEKPRHTRQSRKPGDKLSTADTSKLARYLWKRKNPSVFTWDQPVPALQDPASGTWSRLPYIAQGQATIDTIITATETTKELERSWRARQQQKLRREKRGSSREVLGRFSDEDDGENHDEPAMSPSEYSFRVFSLTDTMLETEESDTDEDNIMEDQPLPKAVEDKLESIPSGANDRKIRFTKPVTLENVGPGVWPTLNTEFFETHHGSYVLKGELPSSLWFARQNMPQSAEDICARVRKRRPSLKWADPLYGEMLRQVSSIEAWERSEEGTQLCHSSIRPEHIFINLSPATSVASMKPTVLEWPRMTQWTPATLPDGIKNARDEGDFGIEFSAPASRKRQRATEKPSNGRDSQGEEVRGGETLRKVKRLRQTYKTRSLAEIPIQEKGRVKNPLANADRLGLSKESELITAFVVFKTLLGGVDRLADIGMILKTFPDMSSSTLKRFWPRIHKERKSFIDALTAKFQTAFLEAYEKGDVAPINYDNIEAYDWRSLIQWASKLETHEEVSLPNSRSLLNETHTLMEPDDVATHWREVWHDGSKAHTSVQARIEAVSGVSMSIPLPAKELCVEQQTLARARSWVRALCHTVLQRQGMPEKVLAKLLTLGDGDQATTNDILDRVVNKLRAEGRILKTKGKLAGQAYAFTATHAKQVMRYARMDVFSEAFAFKLQLDECFRGGKEFFLPYAAHDGVILAVLNMQACGRIRTEAVDLPSIPFGFEPGNYEGRYFPKTYYHFKVKLVPTQKYLYNEDLVLLQQARDKEIPTQGPWEQLPLWVDIFEKLDRARWQEYLSMVIFTIATQGPMTPASACVQLKPTIDEFEAKLIMDWLDSLGLLERFHSGEGATVGEWWWLVAGTGGDERQRVEALPDDDNDDDDDEF